MHNITCADIHFGVGVPLTRMEVEKDPMLDYYKCNRHMVFKCENVIYRINLLRANAYQYGYFRIANYINKFSRLAVVIDIVS